MSRPIHMLLDLFIVYVQVFGIKSAISTLPGPKSAILWFMLLPLLWILSYVNGTK